MAKSSRGVLGWIGCGCLALVLFCGGLGTAAFLFGTGIMKSSEPYQVALQRAQAEPDVQAALGTPVHAGLLVTGSVSVSGGHGDADLAIPLRGPKGKGTLYVVAHRDSGRWVYDTMRLTQKNGKDIDLLSRDADEDEPGVEHL